MNPVEADQSATMLLRDYPSEGGHDEMAAQGVPRSHWQKLIGALEKMGAQDLATRRDTASRILREHGVTYNIYGDTRGLGRPWALDLVPMVIDAKEWRAIEAGLVQRARLLNLVLSDFYGPQRLVREGILPSALLYANPGFLRVCHGIAPPKDIFLSLHAVDLARAPDGQWWAVADRTQAPSGAGYALENRIVLTRVLPDEFRDCRVERLAGFFSVMRDTLRLLAPRAPEQPNVVLLTPGPYNETYFEHVYLARYLGFPLVEGADLTVRNRSVFLKTLEGLQRVHVVLRRLDDTFCDPLELRADSFLGVPGLVEAARAGNVAIANALGSGAVETPAMTAFLPGLARQLLGEDLRLPSVATWWCGQEKEFAYVREHFDELLIKRALSNCTAEPVFGGSLAGNSRAELLAEMKAAPFDFVGQERVSLSTAPVWERGRLEPRPIVFRAFVCATPNGYAVMPGGLVRFSTAPGREDVSMQSGSGSKDTWVLADGPVNQITLLPSNPHTVRLERTMLELPSRVAENLFWLGRYIERLEDTIRILRCVLVRLSGETGFDETPELTALIHLLVNLELFPAKFRQSPTLAAVEREVYSFIYQGHRLGALREVLGRLNHLSFVLRDRFSADTWHALNKLQVDARPRPGRILVTEALALLNTLIADLAAFAGMEMENMTRGHGWRFLDIGRRLERALNINTLVHGGFAVEPAGFSALEPILEIADSAITYRRRYFAQPQWPTALELLLVDDSNPRGLAFQVNALSEHVANLPRDSGRERTRDARRIDTLRGLLGGGGVFALAEAQLSSGDPVLSAFLSRIGVELRGLSDAIALQYFSHATTQAS